MIEGSAIRIRGAGGPEVLERVDDLRLREPGGDEVLVEVAAAGLNRADVLQRRGFYPAPAGAPADIPGLEFAGVVAAVGPAVSERRVGDRVMGICAGGGMATHLLARERELLEVPADLSLEHAAAIPEVFLTAYDAVHRQGQLRMGETLLVHAVGSGVGTAAIQLAHRAGARTLGTSRSQWKLDRCQELGLDAGICVTEGKFAGWVSARTDGNRADVVLDMIGAAYLKENLKSLANRGRLVILGLLGGATGNIPLGLLLARRATLIGSVLRSRPAEEKAALTADFARHVLPGFANGTLQPIVDSVRPMSEVREAHTSMERNEVLGKIVLSWTV